MALLSLLIISVFSAINTNIAQADETTPVFSGSGLIARAQWVVSGRTIDAYFAEQLITPDDEQPLANGLYIKIKHNNGGTSDNVQSLSDSEISWDKFGIHITTEMEFTYEAPPPRGDTRLHVITLDWSFEDNSATLTLDAHKSATGASSIYDSPNSVTVCTIDPSVSAYVTKLTGNKNDLTITVKNAYFDFVENDSKDSIAKFSINNNAAGTYNVGTNKVYVDTKGNDQIRACYFV